MISKNIKLQDFQKTLKNKLEIDEADGLYLFVGKKSMTALCNYYNNYFFILKFILKLLVEESMGEIYADYKDPEDGFLYFLYSDQKYLDDFTILSRSS